MNVTSGPQNGKSGSHSPDPMKSRGEVHFQEDPDSDGSGDVSEKESESGGYEDGMDEIRGDVREDGTDLQRDPERSSSWTDLDLSIIIALVAPIGNWLTGSDHLKNLFLICLLIFYLHQIIEVPWQLYKSSLPRRLPPNVRPPKSNGSHSRILDMARSELRTHEFVYLGLSLASPFVGAFLIQHGLSALSGPDGDQTPLSWFSITLFMLGVGIRPWSHLIKRLRARTEDLHDSVHYHYPTPGLHARIDAESTIKELTRRIEKLERNLAELKRLADENKASLEEGYDDLSDGIREMQGAMKKKERKADVTRTSHERRLSAVEASVAHMLEHWKRQERLHNEEPWIKPIAGASSFIGSRPLLHRIASAVLFIPNTFLSLVSLDNPISRLPPALRVSTPTADGDDGFVSVGNGSSMQKNYISRTPGLETIVEDSDDTTLSTGSVELVDAEEIELKDKSQGDRIRKEKRDPNTAGRRTNTVRDLAFQAVALPYRVAVKILVIAASPVQKHLIYG